MNFPDARAGVLRAFEHRRLWLLDQAAFVAAAELIAAHEAAYQPDVVVGIARGGLPLATHLATRLRTEVVAMAARHNLTDAAYTQATGKVKLHHEAVERLPSGAKLLVVDDICGTGATVAAVTAVLADRCAPALVRTAVLCRNVASDGSAHLPDAWVWRLRDWVVFPWEQVPEGHGEPVQPLTIPSTVSLKETG